MTAAAATAAKMAPYGGEDPPGASPSSAVDSPASSSGVSKLGTGGGLYARAVARGRARPNRILSGPHHRPPPVAGGGGSTENGAASAVPSRSPGGGASRDDPPGGAAAASRDGEKYVGASLMERAAAAVARQQASEARASAAIVSSRNDASFASRPDHGSRISSAAAAGDDDGLYDRPRRRTQRRSIPDNSSERRSTAFDADEMMIDAGPSSTTIGGGYPSPSERRSTAFDADEMMMDAGPSRTTIGGGYPSPPRVSLALPSARDVVATPPQSARRKKPSALSLSSAPTMPTVAAQPNAEAPKRPSARDVASPRKGRRQQPPPSLSASSAPEVTPRRSSPRKGRRQQPPPSLSASSAPEVQHQQHQQLPDVAADTPPRRQSPRKGRHQLPPSSSSTSSAAPPADQHEQQQHPPSPRNPASGVSPRNAGFVADPAASAPLAGFGGGSFQPPRAPLGAVGGSPARGGGGGGGGFGGGGGYASDAISAVTGADYRTEEEDEGSLFRGADDSVAAIDGDLQRGGAGAVADDVANTDGERAPMNASADPWDNGGSPGARAQPTNAVGVSGEDRSDEWEGTSGNLHRRGPSADQARAATADEIEAPGESQGDAEAEARSPTAAPLQFRSSRDRHVAPGVFAPIGRYSPQPRQRGGGENSPKRQQQQAPSQSRPDEKVADELDDEFEDDAYLPPMSSIRTSKKKKTKQQQQQQRGQRPPPARDLGEADPVAWDNVDPEDSLLTDGAFARSAAAQRRDAGSNDDGFGGVPDFGPNVAVGASAAATTAKTDDIFGTFDDEEIATQATGLGLGEPVDPFPPMQGARTRSSEADEPFDMRGGGGGLPSKSKPAPKASPVATAAAASRGLARPEQRDGTAATAATAEAAAPQVGSDDTTPRTSPSTVGADGGGSEGPSLFGGGLRNASTVTSTWGGGGGNVNGNGGVSLAGGDNSVGSSGLNYEPLTSSTTGVTATSGAWSQSHSRFGAISPGMTEATEESLNLLNRLSPTAHDRVHGSKPSSAAAAATATPPIPAGVGGRAAVTSSALARQPAQPSSPGAYPARAATATSATAPASPGGHSQASQTSQASSHRSSTNPFDDDYDGVARDSAAVASAVASRVRRRSLSPQRRSRNMSADDPTMDEHDDDEFDGPGRILPASAAVAPDAEEEEEEEDEFAGPGRISVARSPRAAPPIATASAATTAVTGSIDEWGEPIVVPPSGGASHRQSRSAASSAAAVPLVDTSQMIAAKAALDTSLETADAVASSSPPRDKSRGPRSAAAMAAPVQGDAEEDDDDDASADSWQKAEEEWARAEEAELEYHCSTSGDHAAARAADGFSAVAALGVGGAGVAAAAVAAGSGMMAGVGGGHGPNVAMSTMVAPGSPPPPLPEAHLASPLRTGFSPPQSPPQQPQHDYQQHQLTGYEKSPPPPASMPTGYEAFDGLHHTPDNKNLSPAGGSPIRKSISPGGDSLAPPDLGNNNAGAAAAARRLHHRGGGYDDELERHEPPSGRNIGKKKPQSILRNRSSFDGKAVIPGGAAALTAAEETSAAAVMAAGVVAAAEAEDSVVAAASPSRRKEQKKSSDREAPSSPSSPSSPGRFGPKKRTHPWNKKKSGGSKKGLNSDIVDGVPGGDLGGIVNEDGTSGGYRNAFEGGGGGNDEDSIFHFTDDEEKAATKTTPERKQDSKEESKSKVKVGRTKLKKQGSKRGKGSFRGKLRKKESGTTSDGESTVTTDDEDYGAHGAAGDDQSKSSLAARAQQAWNARHRNAKKQQQQQATTSTLAGAAVTEPVDDRRAKSAPRAGRADDLRGGDDKTHERKGREERQRGGVQLNEEKNTVHRYALSEEETTIASKEEGGFFSGYGYGGGDNSSVGGESATSGSRGAYSDGEYEYDKSYESEVEDFIRDLFFMGKGSRTSPGTRKVKARSSKDKDKKNKSKSKDKEGTEDNDKAAKDSSPCCTKRSVAAAAAIESVQSEEDDTTLGEGGGQSRSAKASSSTADGGDAASIGEDSRTVDSRTVQTQETEAPEEEEGGVFWGMVSTLQESLGLSPTNAAEAEQGRDVSDFETTRASNRGRRVKSSSSSKARDAAGEDASAAPLNRVGVGLGSGVSKSHSDDHPAVDPHSHTSRVIADSDRDADVDDETITEIIAARDDDDDDIDDETLTEITAARSAEDEDESQPEFASLEPTKTSSTDGETATFVTTDTGLSNPNPVQNFLDYASDMLFPPSQADVEEMGIPEGFQEDDDEDADTVDGSLGANTDDEGLGDDSAAAAERRNGGNSDNRSLASGASLGWSVPNRKGGSPSGGRGGGSGTAAEEVGLVELAYCAARARHKIRGMVFDEDADDVDVANEIKFVVVTVALPLGILFQENSAGCWVTRIFPDGNAAKCNAGVDGADWVEVGDQLASIDGRSTIKMKVDDVCDVISSARDPDEIELTFLRYVGPLRPLSNDALSEGYEVEAVGMNDGGGTRNGGRRKSGKGKHLGKSLRKVAGRSSGGSSSKAQTPTRTTKSTPAVKSSGAKGVLKSPSEARYQISETEKTPSQVGGMEAAEYPRAPTLLMPPMEIMGKEQIRTTEKTKAKKKFSILRRSKKSK